MRTYKISFHKQSQNLKQPLVLSMLQINVLEILRFIASVAEDTARGGNSTTIESTNQYFDNHDALDGQRNSIYLRIRTVRICVLN